MLAARQPYDRCLRCRSLTLRAKEEEHVTGPLMLQVQDALVEKLLEALKSFPSGCSPPAGAARGVRRAAAAAAAAAYDRGAGAATARGAAGRRMTRRRRACAPLARLLDGGALQHLHLHGIDLADETAAATLLGDALQRCTTLDTLHLGLVRVRRLEALRAVARFGDCAAMQSLSIDAWDVPLSYDLCNAVGGRNLRRAAQPPAGAAHAARQLRQSTRKQAGRCAVGQRASAVPPAPACGAAAAHPGAVAAAVHRAARAVPRRSQRAAADRARRQGAAQPAICCLTERRCRSRAAPSTQRCDCWRRGARAEARAM